jgi:hypothetical protein
MGFAASKGALHSTSECISETRERAGSGTFIGEEANNKNDILGQKYECRSTNAEIPLTL